MAVASFLLPVVPVHLNDLEDEANDGDDQQTQLNGVRVCNQASPPFSMERRAQRSAFRPGMSQGKTHRLPFIGNTLTVRIPYSTANDKTPAFPVMGKAGACGLVAENYRWLLYSRLCL